MPRKSGTERTMEEIKKELKPFVDIYKSGVVLYGYR